MIEFDIKDGLQSAPLVILWSLYSCFYYDTKKWQIILTSKCSRIHIFIYVQCVVIKSYKLFKKKWLFNQGRHPGEPLSTSKVVNKKMSKSYVLNINNHKVVSVNEAWLRNVASTAGSRYDIRPHPCVEL